jgi:hypothetical protein
VLEAKLVLSLLLLSDVDVLLEEKQVLFIVVGLLFVLLEGGVWPGVVEAALVHHRRLDVGRRAPHLSKNLFLASILLALRLGREHSRLHCLVEVAVAAMGEQSVEGVLVFILLINRVSIVTGLILAVDMVMRVVR